MEYLIFTRVLEIWNYQGILAKWKNKLISKLVWFLYGRIIRAMFMKNYFLPISLYSIYTLSLCWQQRNYGYCPKIRAACGLSHFSHVQLFAWTVDSNAPLSVQFCRQEYWSGFPCPPPGDLSNPGIKLTVLMSSVFAGRPFATSTIWEALKYSCQILESIRKISQSDDELSRPAWYE